MRSIEPLKSICGLSAGLSTAMLELRWLTPTPDAWARFLAEQADAEVHGQAMCIYDPIPFIHSRAFYAFVSSPTRFCALVAVLIASALGWICVERKGRRAAETFGPAAASQFTKRAGGKNHG
jgi:hypothetical protein